MFDIRKSVLSFLIIICAWVAHSQNYQPTASNMASRKWFNEARFGLFIHWGPFSIPGSGEWVMNNRKITVANYSRLQDFFNPTAFNASDYVKMAKNAGMKYITLITRHHDGFSMWDTKYSDFNIMNSPYQNDIVKMFADACHKEGMKLFLYYSLVDWRREDYPHETGRTGQFSGRKGKGNYASYLQFMKNQLTELLSNYGEIAGIWFDGHWDQTAPEGANDRSSRIDWKYDEIYSLIHRLQPQCLVGNNHHLSPFPGEDFQMFEKDLPGENKSGLSFQSASDQLPLETCETINGSWGFNLTDTVYKSKKQLIDYLVKASCLGTNLLLNIGPMPNGKVQPEFEERLSAMGRWLDMYGESIYGTSAGYLKPQAWGGITQKANKMYVHILDSKVEQVDLPTFPAKKLKKIYALGSNEAISYSLKNGNLHISIPKSDQEDRVMVLELAD